MHWYTPHYTQWSWSNSIISLIHYHSKAIKSLERYWNEHVLGFKVIRLKLHNYSHWVGVLTVWEAVSTVTSYRSIIISGSDYSQILQIFSPLNATAVWLSSNSFSRFFMLNLSQYYVIIRLPGYSFRDTILDGAHLYSWGWTPSLHDQRQKREWEWPNDQDQIGCHALWPRSYWWIYFIPYTRYLYTALITEGIVI